MAKTASKKRRKRGSIVHPFAEVGGRLRQAREALTDDTAEAFAKSLGIPGQTYRNYERGGRKLDYDTIEKIADSGISLNWIFRAIKPMIIESSVTPLQKAAN